MNVITKRPILILSTPRSGSTALGKLIKYQCNDPSICLFSEPDYEGPDQIKKFIEYSKSSKNYIVKIHAIHLKRYGTEMSEYLLKSDEVHRISIARRNIIGQISSLYIAMSRGPRCWHLTTDNSHQFTTKVIPIDEQILRQRITDILQCNASLKQANTAFDTELFYEDLPNLDVVGQFKIPEPPNQLEVTSAVTQMLADVNI